MISTWSIGSARPSKNSLQRCRVVGVEGGSAPRVDVTGCTLEPLGIPAHEDDVGTLTARAAGGLEPDAGAAADQDDGLTEQFRLALGGNGSVFGGHDSSVGGVAD